MYYRKKPPKFRLWTFPVLVDGPLGVVSAAELIGIILFIIYVIWAVYAYTVVNFEILPSYGDLTLKEKRYNILFGLVLFFVYIGFKQKPYALILLLPIFPPCFQNFETLGKHEPILHKIESAAVFPH
jgi:hypothetical protein